MVEILLAYLSFIASSKLLIAFSISGLVYAVYVHIIVSDIYNDILYNINLINECNTLQDYWEVIAEVAMMITLQLVIVIGLILLAPFTGLIFGIVFIVSCFIESDKILAYVKSLFKK